MVPPVKKENDYETTSASSKAKKGEEVVRGQNNKSIANMLMGNSKDYSKNIESSIVQGTIVDSQTLVSQTQDRMWRALKRRYQYDSTLKLGQDFLFNHVN